MRQHNWIGLLVIAILLAACQPEPQAITTLENVTHVILTELPAVTATPPPPASSGSPSPATSTQAAYPGPTAIIRSYPGQTVYPTLDPTNAEATWQAVNATSTADTAALLQTATAEEAARPTSASVPTKPPPPMPTRVVIESKPNCEPGSPYNRCHDAVLGIDFDYPSAWGTISTSLFNGYTSGLGYEYSFSENSQHLHAGGRSRDFSEPRDGVWTDFWGFVPDKTGVSGADIVCPAYGATICNTLQPNILFMISFPHAAEICDPAPGIIFHPIATIAINLPLDRQINGFVLSSNILSQPLETELSAILGLGADYNTQRARCQDIAQQQQFDANVNEIIDAIQNSTIDPGTQVNIDQLLHLAQSIRFD